MQVIIKRFEGRWVFEVKEPTHTHGASIGPLVHSTLRRRARKEEVLAAIKDAWNSRLSIKDTEDFCRQRWPDLPFIHKDIINLQTRLKRLKLAGRTSLHDLLYRL
jgi:hypothetical protein